MIDNIVRRELDCSQHGKLARQNNEGVTVGESAHVEKPHLHHYQCSRDAVE